MELIEVPDTGPPLLVDIARGLMGEYAAMSHIPGRWHTVTEDLAALPHPFVRPHGLLLVAKFDDEYVGCGALYGFEPLEIAELKRVYVRDTARGRGIGEAITKQLLAGAARLGYGRVRLDTAPELITAQTLYRRLGFKPIDRYRAEQPENTLCFELLLTDYAT